MITIQGFARLCGCNTQTLRYYDRIGLLTPARVDKWTGYRYYEEEQAMQFVKIKNLQQADFSIEEIRPLLTQDDDRLMAAFEQKIAQQQQKLERIREIQRSYLTETMSMQMMVRALTGILEGRMKNPLLWQEFGMDITQESERSAKVHETLADWLAQWRDESGEAAQNAGLNDLSALKEMLDKLSAKDPDDAKNLLVSASPEGSDPQAAVPDDAQLVFERAGWDHVARWLDDLPDMSDGKQNFFRFRVREDSPAADPAFPSMMLAVMAVERGAMSGGMHCHVARSEDGLNHFFLYRK